MRNTYSPWVELGERPEIDLVWEPMVGRVGQYLHSERRITLDPRMPRHQARSVLCHELRHADAGDEHADCRKILTRQERLADRIAARLLIDVIDLADALVIHGEHVPAVATELRVSHKMVRVRTTATNLHPAELHYLRRRLRDEQVA